MTNRFARAAAALIALLPLPASAWGPVGHEAIGTASAEWLEKQGYTSAQKHVQALLRPGETLASISNWADQIKYGSPLPGDTESQAFLDDERNLVPTVEDGKARHFGFHYTDRPFQARAYEPGGIGARPDDIVGTLNECIVSLQNADKGGQRFSPRVALMLLTHFVGDLHQPLHVGCGYIVPGEGGDWRFAYPSAANGAICDAGGNKIAFKLDGRKTRLHRFWDEHAVLTAAHGRSSAIFGKALALYEPHPAWKAHGPLNTWPRVWASDTLAASREMYAPVRLVSASGEGAAREWTIAFDGGNMAYSRLSGRLADRQLGKAAYRLAELLNAIWPTPGKTPKQ